MKNSKQIASIAVAVNAILGIGCAFAADLPVKAPPPDVTPVGLYDWTGCYIGVEGGGNWGTARNHSFDPILEGDITGNYHLSGGMVGGTLGCNYQTGQFVFGIEGDESWTNKKGDVFALPPFQPGANIQTREQWIATARGRLGYASDGWLFYVTGGAAATSAKLSISDANFVVNAHDTQTRWGWTAGGGVEWAFANNWSVKAEYLHADFGNQDYFVPHVQADLGGGTIYTFLNQTVHLTDDMVRLGVNYRF
jgi:outer membrane immunogenic protein